MYHKEDALSFRLKENPLISVIIPVYNVEQYIKEAVNSVCQQSYKNLEIILVDDGSTDNSSAICDLLAENDNRIRVIHKINGGLSSARNTGLDIATGEYIGFVDSDDYIAHDMYENLLNAFYIENINVGITSGQVLKNINGIISSYNPQWEHNRYNIIKANEFAEKMILTYSNFTCWSKLYRRDLLTKIRFYEGRNNEDSYFIFDISKEIDRRKLHTVEIPHYVYYYRIREGSICTTLKKPLEIDIIKNYTDFKNYFRLKNNQNLVDKIDQYIIYRAFDLLEKLFKNKELYKKYYSFCKIILRINIKNFINNRSLSLKQKIRFILMLYTPCIYNLLKSFRH